MKEENTGAKFLWDAADLPRIVRKAAWTDPTPRCRAGDTGGGRDVP